MGDDPYLSEATLRDYFRIIFRHKGVIFTCVVIVVAVVFLGLQLMTPVYEGKVRMLISAEKQIGGPYYRELDGRNKTVIALTQSEIVKSNMVIERAVKALSLYKFPLEYERKFCSPLKRRLIDIKLEKLKSRVLPLPIKEKRGILFRKLLEDLRDRIKVKPIRDTPLFIITVQDFNPTQAARTANVVSRSYVIFDLEQQLAELTLKYGEKHPIVSQLRDNIYKMNTNLTEKSLTNLDAIGPASVKIIEQAIVPSEPIGSSKKLTLILAFVMSGLLGIILAFVFEHMDQTLKSPRDIEQFLHLPHLGSIPKRKITKNDKAYQTLSDQMYLLIKDQGLQSLLVTSVLPKEGVTTIISNLGKHLANKLHHKILVIDINFRTPMLHKTFKISENLGLSNILEGNTSLEEATHETGSALRVIPAGKISIDPVVCIDSFKIRKVLEEAKEKYELVLIDCANLKDFRDAQILSSYVDGTILVVNEGRTRRQVIKSILKSLEQKKANVIGVILNKRTFPIPKIIYENI